MKPYQVDEKKWRAFSRQQQLQNIAAELTRATSAALHNKEEWREEACSRALSLIDCSIADPKWEDKNFLFQLRDAVAASWTGHSDPAIFRFITTQVLEKAREC